MTKRRTLPAATTHFDWLWTLQFFEESTEFHITGFHSRNFTWLRLHETSIWPTPSARRKTRLLVLHSRRLRKKRTPELLSSGILHIAHRPAKENVPDILKSLHSAHGRVDGVLNVDRPSMPRGKHLERPVDGSQRVHPLAVLPFGAGDLCRRAIPAISTWYVHF